MLGAICSAVLSLTMLLIFFREKNDDKPMSAAGVGICALNGSINKIANFLLVIALAHVDASVQYPMVTGGVSTYAAAHDSTHTPTFEL